MFGFRFIKLQPTDYVLQYRNGELVRDGTGLSFFYFSPTASLVRIPVGSIDTPFIFREITSDFQEISLQGQITYRILEPKKLSQLMNFTLTPNGKEYTSEDPQKLPQRLINHTQVLTNSALKTMPLQTVLISSQALVTDVKQALQKAELITSLGIEILDLSIVSATPTPEMTRALEAKAREQILLQADEAIHIRRNAAVEKERIIKENELNTEIAVENKKRQIRETQMEAEKAVQQKQRELKEAEMATEIALEEKNATLVELINKNACKQADTQAYRIATMMKAFAETDPKIIQALASVGMKPEQLISQAFKELAEGAEKIGELNISPDLMRELLNRD